MAYPTAESRDIAAPAEKVWSLVSDLPRMGESPVLELAVTAGALAHERVANTLQNLAAAAE
jgi:hypothetical protein